MVPTAMPPALTTPNQQAASIGELAPRSSTRLPRHQAHVLDQHTCDAVGLRQQIGIAPAHAVAEHALARAPAALDSMVEQLDRAIQARCKLQLGQLEQELGPAARAVAGCRERRCRRGRCGSWREWLQVAATLPPARLVVLLHGPYHRAHEGARDRLFGRRRQCARRRSTKTARRCVLPGPPARPETSMAADPVLWDISPPVHERAPVFPATRRTASAGSARSAPDCPVNVSAIDAVAAHRRARRRAAALRRRRRRRSATLELAPYLGRCRVIHAIGCGPLIEWRTSRARAGRPAAARAGAHLRARAARPLGRRDLTAYARRRPSSAWPTLGVTLVGIDTASIDPADSKALPSHQVVRRRGLRVLENLVLDDVPEGDYELIALPLKLMQADAVPGARGAAWRRDERDALHARSADTRAVRRARRRRPAGAVARSCSSCPPGLIYLDGNSLGVLPKATADRVQQVVRDEWGRGLIRSWNTRRLDRPAAPRRRQDRAPGRRRRRANWWSPTRPRSTCSRCCSAALSHRTRRRTPQRRVIVSERSNFPTDLYIAEVAGARARLRAACWSTPTRSAARARRRAAPC